MAPKIEKLPIEDLKLGEGPHWVVESQSLYLVDIVGAAILRYHPQTNKYYKANLGVPLPGFIVPVAGTKDKFVVGCETRLYLVSWDGSSDTVQSVEPLDQTDDPATNRINDGKCDPHGRLWFGTMSIENYLTEKSGAFFSYNKNQGVVKHLTGIGISNGLVWDLKKKKFYYNDSITKAIDAFDYDPAVGKIGNRKVIFDYKKNNIDGFPDGITIDSEGKLWVACYISSLVIRIDPDTGDLLQKIEFPTPQVTSVAFGGPKLEDLYVTTAANYPPGEAPPHAGSTFRVTGLGVAGLPMQDFVL